MRTSEMSKFSITLVLYFSLVFNSIGMANTPPPTQQDSAANEAYQEAKLAGKKTLNSKIPPQRWIRGPHLQKVYNRLSLNLNLYRFLSSAQKKLLRSSAKELDQAIESEKNLSPKNTKFYKEVAGRLGQTYLLIFSLAMIGIVKERGFFHIDAASPFDGDKFRNQLSEAFVEIFDSGEILTSMIAAAGTHLAFKAPLEALQNSLGNSSFKGFFKTFMIHLSHTLVSFTGWEFGAQLWKESTFLLDSQLDVPAEREFLKDRNRIFTNAWRALSIKGPANQAEVNAARKIIGLGIVNMGKILMIGSELNIQWLYNAIRLRMINGNFVTLITAMTTASSVGTSLVPGAGTWWGLAFGFFGGLTTVFIPEEYKHEFTLSLKNAFKGMIDSTGGTSSLSVLRDGFDSSGKSLSRPGWTLDDGFLVRIGYRQRSSDVMIEKIFSSQQMITQLATKYENFEIEKKRTKDMNTLLLSQESLVKQGREIYAQLFEELTNLVSFYMTETHLIYPIKTGQSGLNLESINIQEMYIENVYSHFCSMGKGFLYFDPFESSKNSKTSEVLKAFKNACKTEEVPSFKKIADIPLEFKENFDSSVRDLDQVRWTGLNESKLVSERLNKIMLLPN